jgi:hypothetical protein
MGQACAPVKEENAFSLILPPSFHAVARNFGGQAWLRYAERSSFIRPSIWLFRPAARRDS